MNIQFKKGILELCILSMLMESDRYGYDIAQSFADKISVSDGAVYPVLRRLGGDGYVSSYIKESSEGPARKYYAITQKGKKFYASLLNEWRSFSVNVNEITGGNQID